MRQKSRRENTKKSPSDKKKLEIIKKYGLDGEILRGLYRLSYLSRRLDDTEILMRKQNTAFFQISGAGHEGILSAIAKVMKPSHDYFLPYYRDRALCLGLGVTPYEMLCQANGNIGDKASHGRQMPAHWGHSDLNIVNKSSCTGTQFLQSCGLAEAGRYLRSNQLGSHESLKDEVIYCSSGDGTTSQGEFWEGLTTACVNQLPVLFLVEDNGYAISVPVSTQTPEGSISKALANFPDLKIIEVDGNCPVLSYEAAFEAVGYIRRERGPVLLHAHVTRPYSHSLSDDHKMYRDASELEEEAKKDVLLTYPEFLLRNRFLSEQTKKEIENEVNQEIRSSLQRVLKTPWPKTDTVMDHLYSHEIDPCSEEFQGQAEFEGKNDIPMAGAINRTLKEEILKNPLIRVFGEDVADFGQMEKLKTDLKGKGGVFKVTSGLQKNGLPGQVYNSPLAEANIIGRAVGQAIRGIRPVVEIQFFDYIWTAYMQLKNEMATLRYRSGGDFKCPMVVRVPIGGYLKGGAIYHSQSGESLFTHIPGIRVAFPSNALDAIGLLRTSMRCDDPVMFLEHKHLYYQGYNRTAWPGDKFILPFGKANIVKEGKDVTVVCWGALVQKSLEASKQLEKEGFSIEVIDARTLAPFDLETVVKSLKKTNRLLIAHEEHKTSGFSGEITSLINETAFEFLDAPIMRVASMDTHVAYCPGLEEIILPQTSNVTEKLRELLRY